MVKVRWTDYALENLIAIGNYIEIDSPFYAQKVVNSLFNSVDILEIHPLSGRIVPEFENRTIRELIRNNYRIVYKLVTETDINILTVHHAAKLLRDIPNYT